MPATGRWSQGPSGPRRRSEERRRPALRAGEAVKFGIKTAVLAGGLLTALCAAGCGASAGGAGSVRRVTVQGCAAYGVYAIEHHITVTRKPAPCRGLSRAEINQAAATAILRVAGGGPKGVWRRRAAQVARFLNYLITGPAPEASSPPVSPPWSGSSAPVSRPLGGRDLAMDTAALVAWLITAGSGAYVLVTWTSRGGSCDRAPEPRAPRRR
jgi:hypothetical protein